MTANYTGLSPFYERKLAAFGAESIADIESRLPDHRYFRRDIVFGHKGLVTVLDALDAGEDVELITGTMPSGPFHLGHKCLADQIILFQELGMDVTISMADVEAYVSRGRSLERSRETAIEQYLVSLAALGLDLERTDIYLQSSGDSAYHTLGTLLSRNLDTGTFERNYGTLDPGKMSTSLLQYADILKPQLPAAGGPKPTLTPIGIDQENHLTTCRSVAEAYDRTEFHTPAVTYHRFLRGFDGSKMSSSQPSTFVSLADSPEEGVAKIEAMTPGPLDDEVVGGEAAADVLFDLLEFHLIEDDEELARVERAFETGDYSFADLKHLTAERLESLLAAFTRRREEAKPVVDQYIAEQGF